MDNETKSNLAGCSVWVLVLIIALAIVGGLIAAGVKAWPLVAIILLAIIVGLRNNMEN